MSLWSKMKRLANQRYVDVYFRDIKWIKKPVTGGYPYTYLWALREEPAPGAWVEVEVDEGTATAIITEIDVTPERGRSFKRVARCLTQQEVDAAWNSATQAEEQLAAGLPIWLDMMRAKAGLPVERELPKTPPAGWPSIPPKKGTVIGQPAYDRGRVWMRAHHRAAELDRLEDAVVFEQIAQDWYARGRKRKAN